MIDGSEDFSHFADCIHCFIDAAVCELTEHFCHFIFFAFILQGKSLGGNGTVFQHPFFFRFIEESSDNAVALDIFRTDCIALDFINQGSDFPPDGI